jgi:hypothetical protein
VLADSDEAPSNWHLVLPGMQENRCRRSLRLDVRFFSSIVLLELMLAASESLRSSGQLQVEQSAK